MRISSAVALALALLASPAAGWGQTSAIAAAPISWPVQLGMQVPFEPTAFPSGGGRHLIYELYLTNLGSDPLMLQAIEVKDGAAAAGSTAAASFRDKDLRSILQHFGEDGNDPRRIAPGETVVAFMGLSLSSGAPMPEHLVHHVELSSSSIDGAPIRTHRTRLHVLGAPVDGTDWYAADGPGNGRYNHHRRGLLVQSGRLSVSRRYAIDWKQARGGVTFDGDPHRDASYYAYGQTVLAVADAKVVETREGLPDNPPGHGSDFHPALPVTIANAGGNTVTLDLGGGQFAHYYHLQPGSLRVKAGEHVRRGQPLARIGASGDAREPHLHFEVTTDPRVLMGEGVPYVLETYRDMGGAGRPATVRRHELPMDEMTIDFGSAGRNR